MDRMLLNVLLFVSWLVVNAAESADPLTSNSESDNKACNQWNQILNEIRQLRQDVRRLKQEQNLRHIDTNESHRSLVTEIRAILNRYTETNNDSLSLDCEDKIPFTPASSSRLGKYRTAAVSSDGIPCSDIGRDVMKDGGNAMDAAIATLFCVGVVNPQSAGIGGGFLMTVYDSKTGTARCLDARETAPAAATEDMFKGNATLARIGGLAVAVPSELKGYWEAHQAYGKLPWSRLVLPAAELAEKGVLVNSALSAILIRVEKTIRRESSMTKIFVNETTGELLKLGDTLKMPILGKTLRMIASEGIEPFYNGSIGDILVKDVVNKGGILTKEDLMEYRVKWLDPVKVDLTGNLTVYSIPPPGSGVLTAYILNILDDLLPRDKAARKDPLTYHRIAEAFKHAFAYRTKLADPAFSPEVDELAKLLTSKELASETRAKIKETEKTNNDPVYYGAVTYNADDHGTAHVSVLDGEGLAVSVTSTINLYFGAAFISEETGIILNDEMDDFASPNVINFFGLPPSPANFIRPGKRPLSSMTPTIVVANGQVRSVIGAAGGTRITTSVAYALIRNLWFGENIKEAYDARRIHHQLFPMSFLYEAGFPKDIVDQMRTRNHNVTEYIGGSAVYGITVEDDEFLYANADHRKGGDVAGIDEAL